MADSYTEVSHQGYFSRIAQSIKQVVFGLLLFIGSFVLLFWNEGRAIKQSKSLEEGKKTVIRLEANDESPSTEGKLIFLSGMALPKGVALDADFRVSADALRLRRIVEMYQWEEDEDKKTEKHTGGSTTTRTTYRYSKKWSEEHISSGDFKIPEGHQNPGSMPYETKNFAAPEIHVGLFELSEGLVKQINSFEPFALTSMIAQGAPSAGTAKAKLNGNYLFYGIDPNSPSVGDLRVHYEQAKATNVSLAAMQQGKSLGAFRTRIGNTIELLEVGLLSSDQLFDNALAENALITWLVRAGGFFIMFLGLLCLLGPLAVIFDVLPFLGSMVGFGIGLGAFCIAAVLSLLTIAIAWIFYRPLAAVLLLGVVAAIIYGAKKKNGKADLKLDNQPQTSMAPPPPPPPPPVQSR